jgi:dinuclear metal center YbgI/SA1388 family protein
MEREQLTRFLDDTLESARFADYSPNGLQVEGGRTVRNIITGVTASLAFIEAALSRGADTLIVHHGYFWKGESPRIVGSRRQRLAALLKNDLNLYAYHLPLDAHPELGNNAQWAARMGWRTLGRFGEQNIGFHGEVGEAPLPAEALAQALTRALDRPPLLVGDPERPIRRIAWCSGGGQSLIEEAAALGVDAYCSGEISEPTPHLARENGIAYLACGHHATERFGPAALAARLATLPNLRCEFLDLPNPA